MARTLEAAKAELEPYYAGSRNVIQTKLNAIPGEIEAGIAQADAKLGQANDNILAGARRRGLGFSGIPVGEQAQYAATEYAPAIANMRTAGKNQELSLLETLNSYDRDQRQAAQGLVDGDLARGFQERQFQEQIRQFNEQMAAQERQAAQARAAQQADISRYLGGGAAAGAGAGGAGGATMTRNEKGYQFTGANGRPITALAFAQSKGIGVRQLLKDMAANGDVNAKAMLPFVNDAGQFQNIDQRFAGAAGALGLSGSYSKNIDVGRNGMIGAQF